MTEVWDSSSNNKRVAAEMLAAARAEQQVYKARQRARRIDIEVHSCASCPYMLIDTRRGWVICGETHIDVCTSTSAVLSKAPIPDSCPLEVSYGDK